MPLVGLISLVIIVCFVVAMLAISVLLELRAKPKD